MKSCIRRLIATGTALAVLFSPTATLASDLCWPQEIGLRVARVDYNVALQNNLTAITLESHQRRLYEGSQQVLRALAGSRVRNGFPVPHDEYFGLYMEILGITDGLRRDYNTAHNAYLLSAALLHNANDARLAAWDACYACRDSNGLPIPPACEII